MDLSRSLSGAVLKKRNSMILTERLSRGYSHIQAVSRTKAKASIMAGGLLDVKLVFPVYLISAQENPSWVCWKGSTLAISQYPGRFDKKIICYTYSDVNIQCRRT